MRTGIFIRTSIVFAALLAAAIMFSGCETTDSSGPSSNANAGAATTATSGKVPSLFSEEYHATDGRTIVIGRATAADGGWKFREPHLDKCWIADGFNFTGYDVIYIAPTESTAKIHDDEKATQELARENLVIELNRKFKAGGIFPKVVTEESAIPANGRVLRLENTILAYSKGGGAARFFVGLYGGGQPMFRVHGKLTDAGKTVFEFEGSRSGVSAASRMDGVAMKDEDIQLGDIQSLVLDLTDFMSAVAGKYTPRR